MNKILSMLQEFLSARKTYPTLGERLDNIDTNLSNKMSILLDKLL